MKLVRVTQELIDEGVQASCSNCPVALAIDRAFDLPRHIEAHVFSGGDGDVVFTNCLTGQWRCKRFPPEVRSRIKAFDRGEGMEPFEFRLSESRLREIGVGLEGAPCK